MSEKLYNFNDEGWEIIPKLSIDEIKGVSQFNVRANEKDDELELDELVKSIVRTGINVMPITLDEKNEVISGNRRYKASLKADLKYVFAIRKTMTEFEKMFRSFAENELQLEMTDKHRRNFATYAFNVAKISVAKIAEQVSKDETTIYRWLNSDVVPKTSNKEAIEEYNKLPPKKKANVLSASKHTKNEEVINKMIKGATNMTVAQTEAMGKESADKLYEDDTALDRLETKSNKGIEVTKNNKYAYDKEEIYITKKLKNQLIEILKKGATNPELSSFLGKLDVDSLIEKIIINWAVKCVRNLT